ncbi:hypothetical protein DPMN_194494 [Dreissena polymorpha]|uniref:Sushi domain-containing protein n=1 Tax=Dreissena polymorpha TaxID=45954 RepID=A0A9D3XX69_DREPO|nr:hypothetical protein DPMN_194494 [Dreissena polymorpha]
MYCCRLWKCDGARKSHSEVTERHKHIQSTAELTCINGYRLKDGHNNNSATLEHIKCTSDGIWANSTGCEMKGIIN